MLTQLVDRKRDARHLEDACASVNTSWQSGRRHRRWCHWAARSQNTLPPGIYAVVFFGGDSLAYAVTVSGAGRIIF